MVAYLTSPKSKLAGRERRLQAVDFVRTLAEVWTSC